MGNTGSGQRSDGEARAQEPAKTCYYKLLAVEKNATQEEIKKAYRKKALELHPDRNYNDVERTTKLFAEVQAAYEILSDPQERAWYDAHPEAILRDGNGPSADGGSSQYTSTTTSEETYRWFGLFPNKSKIDYSDSPNGFYSTLRQTFEKLAREEREACMQEGLEEPYLPGFGDSRSGYEYHVKEFYHHWTSFRTCKTFSWMDQYRLPDAPDRRIRRVMEKENKKFRDEAIREFNENIRQFVLFVRKRDPRYTPPHAGMTEAERQAAILNHSKEQAAKARAQNAAKLSEYKAASWMEPSELASEDFVDDGEEEEEEMIVHECVACKKSFKTEAQFTTHERSNKHKKAVQQLRKKMQKEDRELGLEREGKSTEEMEVADGESGADGVATNSIDTVDEDSNSPPEHNLDPAAEPTGAEKVDDTSATKTAPTALSGEEEESDDDVDVGVDDDHVSITEFQARVLGVQDDDDDLTAAMSHKATLNDIDSSNDNEEEGSTPSTPSGPKMGKAKLKREKRKAAAATSKVPEQHKCGSCQQTFPSKQKVFNHLREFPSHAVHVSAQHVKGSSGGGNSKKKKGGKK